MKRFKLIMTENQLKIIDMAIQEATDANSYQLDMGGSKKFEKGYKSTLKALKKLQQTVWAQIDKQRK